MNNEIPYQGSGFKNISAIYNQSINKTKKDPITRINMVINYMKKHNIDTVDIDTLVSIWDLKKNTTKILINRFPSGFENIKINTYKFKYPTWKVKEDESI